jgi:CheY-like chemotaxis protein
MSSTARIASTPPQREVVRILALAYGDEKRATEAVSRALSESGISHLPEGPTALFEFVAREMVPALTSDLGPRLTIALLAELEAFRDSAAPAIPAHPVSEAPVTGPRRRHVLDATASVSSTTRRRVLLVDADRLRRANIARALLRAKCDVSAVESAKELRASLEGEPRHDLAVVDLGGPTAVELLEVFSSVDPDLPLVAFAPDPEATDRVLSARRVKAFVTCARSTPPDDIAGIVNGQLAGQPRR